MRLIEHDDMGVRFLLDLEACFQCEDADGVKAVFDELDRDEEANWVEALAGWLQGDEEREVWIVPIASAHNYGWHLLTRAEALLRRPAEVAA